MIPHKCPVCNGTGLVSCPPNIAGDQVYFTSDKSGPWECKACKGTCIIWEFILEPASESTITIYPEPIGTDPNRVTVWPADYRYQTNVV